jgi:hypothetical protein
MTQDVIVTLIAFAIVVGYAVRRWRRRGRQEPACASCESSTSRKPERTESAIKPVAFFGGSGKRRIH